jgi:Kef-type K+ transport system membrane component KefB
MIVNQIKEKTSPSLVLLILAILALTYLAMKFIPVKHFKKVSIGLVNLGLRLIIVVILLLVWLSEKTGGELILGAFLVGMVLKGAHISHRIEERLLGFGYGIFIPMFFILLGTRIPLLSIIEHPDDLLLTLYLTLALLFVKIPFIYLMRWYKMNVTIPTMVIVTCTIIASVAAEEMEVFTEDFAHSLITASVLTCLLPPIVFEWLFPFKHCHNKFECEEYITVKENEE